MGRPKLNRVHSQSYKISPETTPKLEKLAMALGYKYGSGAAMGKFLDMVADLDPVLLAWVVEGVEKKNQNKPTNS